MEAVLTFNQFEIFEGMQSIVKFGKENIEEIKKRHDFNKLPHSFRFITLGVGRKQ